MSFLGGLGAGLHSGASTYLQMKHGEEDRKRNDTLTQLQGLQLLLGQNDLPNDVYMNAIGAVANLTKDPSTMAVYDHLKGQMNQQVPLGPEKQTLDSMMQRLMGGVSQQADKGQGLTPTPLPDVQTAPSMVRAGDVPRNVYNQSQTLPLRIAERQASMKPSQMVLPDGRTALVGPDGSIVGIVNAKPTALAATELRNKAAGDRLTQRLNAEHVNIGERAHLKARADIDKAMARGLTEPQAIAEVTDKLKQEAAIRLGRAEVLRQQAKAIPAGVAQRWAALDDADIRIEIARELAGNKVAGDQFDAETKPLFTELQSTRDIIEKLVHDDPQSPELPTYQQYEQDLLNGIYAAKGRFSGGIKPPPSSTTVKPKSDPLGLFNP